MNAGAFLFHFLVYGFVVAQFGILAYVGIVMVSDRVEMRRFKRALKNARRACRKRMFGKDADA